MQIDNFKYYKKNMIKCLIINKKKLNNYNNLINNYQLH